MNKLTVSELTEHLNPILNIDSYKASHFLQFPPNAKYLNSYIESRGGLDKATIFFGLQAYLKQYLLKPISKLDIDVAEKLLNVHGLPFNRSGWEYILEHHQGYLPIEIYAVPEGMLIPTHNVLVQIRNTDPNCCWLPSYLETGLLRSIWYPTTVATKSFKIKQILKKYIDLTVDNPTNDDLIFKLHDFGARSASSYESSELGGMAHLLSFAGTDTLTSIIAINKYYNSKKEAIVPAFSIPAAEHSTITSWKKEGELDAFANMVDKFAKLGGLYAVVCDSYDLFNAVEKYLGTELKVQIESSGSTLVIRPDSGDPVDIVIELCEKLFELFSYHLNNKGYKVFDHIRIIQGDGVNIHSINAICKSLVARQISLENVNFGMGTELLQNCNRDTQRFAMKASAVYLDNKWVEISKQPVTDPIKVSKKGIQKLVCVNGVYQTIKSSDPVIPFLQDKDDLLELVYRNGKIIKQYEWSELVNQVQSQIETNLLGDINDK